MTDQTQSEQVRAPDPQIPLMQLIGYFEPGVGLSVGIVPRGHDHTAVIAKNTYRNMQYVISDLQSILALAHECQARIALEKGHQLGYQQAMRDVAAQAAANNPDQTASADEPTSTEVPNQVREAVIDLEAALAAHKAEKEQPARGNEPPEGRTDVEQVPDLKPQVPSEDPAGGWMAKEHREDPPEQREVSDRQWAAQDPGQREQQ